MGIVTIRVVVAMTVAFVTVQALYWPLLPKPGTELHWWQLQWAADIGYIVGAPVLGIVAISPLHGFMQQLFALSLAAGWAVAIYWVTGLIVHAAIAKREANAT